jgi:hypothetical protein
MVARDQKDNGGAFHDTHLEYYEERQKNKQKTATNDDGGKRQKSSRYLMTWLDLLPRHWKGIIYH